MAQEISKNHEINGQYYSPDENSIINLATVTKLWHQDDGLFSTKDRLYFTSAGEDSYTEKSPDEIKDLFNRMADDGSFIQIGKKLINTKSIQSARIEGKYLYYQLAGDEEYEKMTADEARPILDKLSQQKRFYRVDEDHVVNMNKVVNLWFKPGGFMSNDRLRINFMGQSDMTIDMPQSEARRVMSDAERRPQFKRIGNETVNIAVAGNIWADGDTLHIKYPGTSCTIDMERPADIGLSYFDAKAGYISVGDERVNPKITSEGYYSEGFWWFKPKFHFNILSDSVSMVSETRQSEAAFQKLAAMDDYVQIDDKVVNINSIGKANYDGKHLNYTQGPDENYERVSADEAEAIMNKIFRHEKFVEIDSEAVNAQFAARMEYDGKKMTCVLGRDEHSFKISQSEAQSILDKVKGLGIKKQADLDAIKSSPRSADDADDDVFDPDLLAEIYEEIDTMHTTNIATMAAVIVIMNANTTATVGR